MAVASDPYEAVRKITEFKPDVLTCDVQMPGMNGIEFIRQLIPQYPIPIIVVSSMSSAVFDAMAVGAVDFLTKPAAKTFGDIEIFIREMKFKIKIASKAKISKKDQIRLSKKSEYPSCEPLMDKVIAIGASTGGTESISELVGMLPTWIPGIVIVQHIPATFSRMFAERLDALTMFRVKEAQTGDFVESGKILIAPGDMQMQIVKAGTGYQTKCFFGEKVNGHCPSVDVLFESVAVQSGENAIGVILTGMGYDGAKGMLKMRRKGARTIGQDENSSIVYGMPKSAYAIGAVEMQVPLNEVAEAIISVL